MMKRRSHKIHNRAARISKEIRIESNEMGYSVGVFIHKELIPPILKLYMIIYIICKGIRDRVDRWKLIKLYVYWVYMSNIRNTFSSCYENYPFSQTCFLDFPITVSVLWIILLWVVNITNCTMIYSYLAILKKN